LAAPPKIAPMIFPKMLISRSELNVAGVWKDNFCCWKKFGCAWRQVPHGVLGECVFSSRWQ
jgi:hypothetical protein